jgi:NodT family efflux transporter outer membrane factor (OMF) lipoprotein
MLSPGVLFLLFSRNGTQSGGTFLMGTRRYLFLLAAAVHLSGCAVGPDYLTPEMRVPAQFSGRRDAASKAADTAGTPSVDPMRWWRAFRDPELNSLVDRAIAANPDIEIALTRVQEARERETVVIGAALPTVGVSSAVAGGSGPNSVKGRVSQSLNAGINTTGFSEVTQMSGFDANWELDLFGKYRREFEAARYDTEAAIAMRSAVLVVVAAAVARSYVDLRGLQAQVAVVKENIDRAQKTVDLVQTRYNRGLTNEFDVTLAKRELATLQAQLPPLIAAIAEAESQIAVLLGTYSGDVVGELERPRKIPHTPTRLRTGQPVDLLRRRPDIQQAERELASATALIGAAVADLFPRVGVIAGVGLQSGRSAGGSTPAFNGPIWSVGPAAYWPFLDFGRLDALIDIQEFRAHELLVNYKKLILVAVEEVDNAIKQYRALLQRQHDLGIAVDASRQAVDLATERYERGLTDFLNVLDAQRQEFDLEAQYVVAQQAAAVEFVFLYKALGGGWELYQDLPPIPVPEPAVVATFRRLSQTIPW